MLDGFSNLIEHDVAFATKQGGQMNRTLKNRGVLIVIEGGEGSGKTTTLSYLQRMADSAFPGEEVIFTREPGGTEFGAKLREQLLSPHSAGKISALTELFTFCAIRANHCDMLIRPALDEGKVVICDRFYDSTVAYQLYGREQMRLLFAFTQLNAYATGGGNKDKVLVPDLVIFLDVKPEVGLRRARSRPEGLNRLDAEELEFHKRVRQGYLAQYQNASNAWLRINTGARTIGEVNLAVRGAIRGTIRQKRRQAL